MKIFGFKFAEKKPRTRIMNPFTIDWNRPTYRDVIDKLLQVEDADVQAVVKSIVAENVLATGHSWEYSAAEFRGVFQAIASWYSTPIRERLNFVITRGLEKEG
jgi:hypothetical protein